jgi:hypothetical protein
MVALGDNLSSFTDPDQRFRIWRLRWRVWRLIMARHSRSREDADICTTSPLLMAGGNVLSGTKPPYVSSLQKSLRIYTGVN